MKILIIFGTRPEALKMAVLANKLKENQRFTTEVCVTGQHREMLDQVLSLFAIKPKYDLNIMKHGQTLTDVTCDIIQKLPPVFEDYVPDLILVHGDTTTAFAASSSETNLLQNRASENRVGCSSRFNSGYR